MSDGDGRESKTEEPTERRIQDAVDKGNVPFSHEAVTLGSLLAILLVVKLSAAWFGGETLIALELILARSGDIRLQGREDSISALSGAVLGIGMILMPVIGMIAAGGILAALLQNVPQAAAERVRPKLSRVSPVAGWKRIFGAQGLVEFAKTAVKFIAVAVVTAVVLRAEWERVRYALQFEPIQLPGLMLDAAAAIVTFLCALSLAMAAFDVAWSRFSWRRSLRMSREELKEEFRQAEGDPHFKARARTIARQRATRNMFKKLPAATMVITNPTHYAVALRYSRDEGGVPAVVAKGLDHLALRIREAAEGYDIPLVENKPLARSLYDSVDVGEAIPPELYRAVAEIIHYLHMRGRYASVRSPV